MPQEQQTTKLKNSNWLIIIIIVLILIILVGSLYFLYFCHKEVSNNNNINNNINNTNISQNSNVNSDNYISRDELKRLTVSCVRFIEEKQFINPEKTFYDFSNSQPLKELANNWDYGKICRSADSYRLFIIDVERPTQNGENINEAINQTKKLFPKFNQENLQDSGSYHEIFIYADYPTDFTYQGKKITLKGQELYSVTKFVWSAGESYCVLEPGNYVADQGFTIACGSSANGCATIERVKWNLFDQSIDYLGTCTNNCDLNPNESYLMNCQQNYEINL